MVLFRFPAFFMHYLTESFRPFCIFVPMLEKNEIIQSALQNLKIESLNPMQEAALEQGTGRKDVILLSPTGSGKTLAYLLPLLLILKPNDDSVQVLEAEILRMNREASTTFLIASHDRATLEHLCTKILRMEAGHLA